MKNLFRLALIALALAVATASCAPRGEQNANQLALSTPTTENLPGGLLQAPADTLPVATLPPVQTPTTQPTLPPIPTMTLVPTIVLPAAAPTLPPAPPTTPLPTAPAPAAPAAQLDPACLNGVWQVTDLQQAMAGSLAQNGSTLALERVDGQARYVFSADGGMSLTYLQLAAVLNGTVENREVRVVQSLDGSATARYTVDPAAGTIEMSGFGGEGIRSALAINGQTLAEGSLPVWLAFTRGQPQSAGDPAAVQFSRAAAVCDGSTLTLQALEPVPGPVLRLERVQE